VSDRLQTRMRRRLQELIWLYQQLVDDALAWNALHPDQPPLDAEGDRVAVSHARRALAALECDDGEKLAYWSKRLRQSVEQVGDPGGE
jgi:hypothetical protein